jgi:hypothetical protein
MMVATELDIVDDRRWPVLICTWHEEWVVTNGTIIFAWRGRVVGVERHVEARTSEDARCILLALPLLAGKMEAPELVEAKEPRDLIPFVISKLV